MTQRPLRRLLLPVLLACGLLPAAAEAQRAPAKARERPIPIDLEHILEGRINGRGQLVGVHHAPSAPKTMRVEGRACTLEIEWTSPGTEQDVRTARVRLRDPDSDRVVLEKFSTLYPSAWTARQIEAAIREAYADAKAGGKVEDSGRWQGRTRSGVRIDGYLSYDGDEIATAFPVYSPPRNARRSR